LDDFHMSIHLDMCGITCPMLQTSTLPLSEEGTFATWKWLSLQSYKNVPHIIVHHKILIYLIVYFFFNYVTHECHEVWKLLQRPTLPDNAPRSLNMLRSILQGLLKPSRSHDRAERSYLLLPT